jgi:molybdate transport system substrate-binding protein
MFAADLRAFGSGPLFRTIGPGRRALLAALFCASLAAGRPVAADDLRVLCPSALRQPMLELARAYARTSGQRVELVFASIGAVHKRTALGEYADVVIGGSEGVGALVKLGSAEAGSRLDIARTALALAGRAGGGLHAADDAASLARVLKAAASLGVPDPGRGVPGGAQAMELLERLRLSEALQPRIRWLNSAAEAGKLLAAGRIELALVAMSEVVGMTGISIVGPLVAPPTQGLVYAAAVPRSARNPELGRAFIAHLRSPAAAGTLRQAGYLPAD